MISGYTGEAFRTDIFIGPVYYQRLRHMVSDKFQVSLMQHLLHLQPLQHEMPFGTNLHNGSSQVSSQQAEH